MFGAAVRPGGIASPALARRTSYAAAAAQRFPEATLFLSGAKGRHGPAEAIVMARLLDGWVESDRLRLDTRSRDTLQSVRAAAAFAKRHGFDEVLICTDRYHQPRVRMLFALAGVRARSLPIEQVGDKRVRRRMKLREVAAIPYDLVAGSWAIARDRLGKA